VRPDRPTAACVDHLKHGVSEAGAATARREGGGKVLGNLTDTEGLTCRQDTRNPV